MQIEATADVSIVQGPLSQVAQRSTVLIQSSLTTSDPRNTGRLVDAVHDLWFDVIAALVSDPRAAFEIPSDRWEEIIAGYYRRVGFETVILTPRSGDLGRDVIAVKEGLGTIRVIDQVKAYAPGHLVTADDVRALYGVVVADNASKGFLTTTSDFAPRLRSDALLEPLIPSRIELIDGRTLMSRLGDLQRKGRR